MQTSTVFLDKSCLDSERYDLILSDAPQLCGDQHGGHMDMVFSNGPRFVFTWVRGGKFSSIPCPCFLRIPSIQFLKEDGRS